MELIGVTGRWLAFIAILICVGAAAFAFLLRRARIEGADRAEMSARSASIGIIAAVAVVVAANLRLIVQVEGLRFPDDPWLDVASRLLVETDWGTVWLVQVGAACVAAIAFALQRRYRSVWDWVVAVVALGLAMTPTMSSHARSSESGQTMLPIISDVVHLIAAGTWVGTLSVMFLSVAPLRGPGSGRSIPWRSLLERFSPLALGSAAMLVSTGVVSSFMHVPTPQALVTSSYGRLLLLKLLLVFVVIVLGWRNWRVFTPRIETDGGVGLRRGMAGEVIAAALVLLVTALLVATPPPDVSGSSEATHEGGHRDGAP